MSFRYLALFTFMLNPFSSRETVSLKDLLFYVDTAGGVFPLGGARQGRGGRTGGGAQHQGGVSTIEHPPPQQFSGYTQPHSISIINRRQHKIFTRLESYHGGKYLFVREL